MQNNAEEPRRAAEPRTVEERSGAQMGRGAQWSPERRRTEVHREAQGGDSVIVVSMTLSISMTVRENESMRLARPEMDTFDEMDSQ